MRQFAGRTAVVTGAASGIGLALAKRFAELGMRVVLADADGDRLEKAVEAVSGDSGDVLAVLVDVRSPAAVDSLAARAADSFGDVHLLCNNAGILRVGTATSQSLEDWHQVLNVNFWGVLHGVQAFVPRMLAHGEECHVVNTASLAGLFPTPAFASYSVSKAAVVSLSHTLATDVAQRSDGRMGVSVLCPGGVSTNIFRSEVERRSKADRAELDSTADEILGAAAQEREADLTPDAVARAVEDAVRHDRFYVLPMQEAWRRSLARHVDVLARAVAGSTAPTDDAR